MSSITYWNRLEPRPLATDLAEALAARIADPAWLLARQWQLGEFRGEDAGAPAYVKVEATVGRVRGWGAPGASAQALAATVPVEAQVTAEPGGDDLAHAVELGQTFELFLAQASATDLRSHFLTAYPIGAGADVVRPWVDALRKHRPDPAREAEVLSVGLRSREKSLSTTVRQV